MLDRKVTGVAYETITDRKGRLPLLTPMSEVAGRMSVQVGATYLEKMNGGRGILLGGVPGVPAANVVIIGGGIVGTEAAKMAVGLGAKVTIIDRNLDRLRQLDDIFLSKVQTLASSPMRSKKRSHTPIWLSEPCLWSVPRRRSWSRVRCFTLSRTGRFLSMSRSIRADALKRRTRRHTLTRHITKKACCITASQICPVPFRAHRPLR